MTALYEVEIDESATPASGFLAEVRLRHKAQFGADSKLQSQGIKLSEIKADVADASQDLRLAMAVTEYAEILRGSKHTEGKRLDDVRDLIGNPADPRQVELLDLVDRAEPLLP